MPARQNRAGEVKKGYATKGSCGAARSGHTAVTRAKSEPPATPYGTLSVSLALMNGNDEAVGLAGVTPGSRASIQPPLATTATRGLLAGTPIRRSG